MSQVMSENDQFRAELNELGEEKVQARLVLDAYGVRQRPIVVGWLAQQAEKRQADAQERQESPENETLVLARRAEKHADHANEYADEANRLAWIATVIAVMAMIVSAIK
jgi:hypothetical protein